MTAADEHPPHRADDDDESGEPTEGPSEGEGAEGEGSADTPPPAPSEDDDSPLGDTDQHSVSDA